MTETPVVGDDPAAGRLVAEMFLKAAGPALVKRVAEVLQKLGIPVMPLKGVLLQKLVYGEQKFRPISDVDVLVPEGRFLDACAALRSDGFTDERWERGGWQVIMRNPLELPLGIDLHRCLTRTSRSRLTTSGLFQRGKPDSQLFGTPVMLPCSEDLFAHLLLHATLNWLNLGRLHRPQDFEALANATAMDVDRCARHLSDQGLIVHAQLMLPLIATTAGGSFVECLASRLPSPPRAQVSRWLVRTLADRYPKPGHIARRLAGLALAPSLSRAIATAVKARIARPLLDTGAATTSFRKGG